MSTLLKIISKHVELEKRGGYMSAMCPGCKEGGFTYSPDRDTFYCFSCHRAGVDEEAFKKLMAGEGSYGERVSAIDAAAKWFHAQMLESDDIKRFIKGLGISDEKRDKMKFGYFPPGTKSMNQFVSDMANLHVTIADLTALKMVAKGRMNFYSAFEDRVIYPIKIARENGEDLIVGFCGATWRKSDERSKFYYSTPMTGSMKKKYEDIFRLPGPFRLPRDE